jgi:AcrR family transcriptional regulator
MASPGPDLSPRGREIVDAARELIEGEGLEALTMRRLGDAIGVKAPSLYKHFPDKDTLEAAVISIGFEEFGAVLSAAVDGAAADPLGALASAYREFAKDHPDLYRLMTERALDRELLAPGSEQRGAQAFVDAAGGDRDLARAMWAFAHGMTILELNRRFPADAEVDLAWGHGLDAFRGPARKG